MPEKILALRVNKLILQLANGIEYQDDIKNIYDAIQDSKDFLHEIDNYNKSLHCVLADAVYTLNNLTKDKYNIQKFINDIDAESLTNRYNENIKYCIRKSLY